MLSLVVLMAALLGMASVYAHAPVIGSIPDIILGDDSPHAGVPVTEDLNIFEYANAIDLATKVTDDNTPPADIQWSFIETDGVHPTSNYSINGKMSGLNTNLTGVGGTLDTSITFIDENLSPHGSHGAYPFPNPPTTTNDIRDITFFASDLDLTTTATIQIKSVNGAFNSKGVEPVHVATYNFPTDTANWSTLTGVYGTTTFNTSGAALSITSSSVANTYGRLRRDNAIPYNADAVLYRATWNVTSSGQTDTSKLPGIRTMFNTEAFTDNIEQQLLSDQVNGADTGIPLGNFQYQQYFGAPDLATVAANGVGGTLLDFEMINYGPGGTLALNSVVVDKFTSLPESTNQYTYSGINAFPTAEMGTGTAFGESASIYGPVTVNNTVLNVALTSPTTLGLGGVNFGGIRTKLPSETGGQQRVTATAGNFYRARFEVTSSVASTVLVPCFRMRMFTEDQRQSVVRQLTGRTVIGGTSPAIGFSAQMPTATPKFYDLYFAPHGTLPTTADSLGFAFEITDFDAVQGGTITLNSVAIDSIVNIP
jgi:hypothetical protein